MDDITFCLSECKQTDCFRHPSNIQDRTIPHSYADFRETETCPEFAKDINVPINDCISRQAAIEAVLDRCPSDYDSKYECGYYDALKEAVPMLIHVPSVQPNIIRCKDCESWQTDWALNDAPGIHFCAVVDGFHEGDWYCADAKRRTDE